MKTSANQEVSAHFVLVDLESQAKSVSELVKGWKREDILSWMAERGSLQRLKAIPGQEAFCFESAQGFKSLCFLDGDQFTFIGDNTTWQPK